MHRADGGAPQPHEDVLGDARVVLRELRQGREQVGRLDGHVGHLADAVAAQLGHLWHGGGGGGKKKTVERT